MSKVFFSRLAFIAFCCGVGVAAAKLPPAPPVDPAVAEAAKKKAADAAKAEAAQLAKAQDRAVARYKGQSKGASAAPAAKTKKK